MAPRVTVIMPVFNSEKYINEAITSILSQSFSDFEFMIINDGSTDKSVDIIKSFTDERIRLINNKNNIGQVCSYNNGFRLARGDYIIIMHADDISLQDRIKRQVEFMDANLEIGISGTWVKLIGDRRGTMNWQPTDPEIAKCLLLFHIPMIHPSIIIRKEFIVKHNLYYNASYETAEDYGFFLSASEVFPISNLGEVLLLYRIHSEQVSCKDYVTQNQVSRLIRMKMLNHLGLFPNSEEFRIHNLIGESLNFNTKEDVISAFNWLRKIEISNKQKHVFDSHALSKYLAYRWFRVCKNASSLGIWAFRTYLKLDYSRNNQIGLKLKTRLFVKCIIKYDSTLKTTF